MKIREAGRPDRRPIGRGMHMDDVGAERDMDGRRNPGSMRCSKDARVAELELCAFDLAAGHFTETPALLGGDSRGAIQKCSSLLDHAEIALVEFRRNVLRSASGKGQFEVMDDGGSIGSDATQNAVSNQPADERTEANLDRVGPHHQKKSPPLEVSGGNRAGQISQIPGRKRVWQSVEEF